MRLKFDALKSAPFHAHHYNQADVNVQRISSSILTAVLKKLRSESKLNNPFYVALNLGLCFRVGYLVRVLRLEELGSSRLVTNVQT